MLLHRVHNSLLVDCDEDVDPFLDESRHGHFVRVQDVLNAGLLLNTHQIHLALMATRNQVFVDLLVAREKGLIGFHELLEDRFIVDERSLVVRHYFIIQKDFTASL